MNEVTQLQTQPDSFNFDSLVDSINKSERSPVDAQPSDEFNRLLDLANTPSIETGFTPVGAEAVRELKRQIAGISLPAPDVPIIGGPSTDTSFVIDIAKGAGRAFFGLMGNITAAPEAIAEITTGEPPDIVRALIDNVTRPISEFSTDIARSEKLRLDPVATPTLPGFAGVKQALFNPEWWSGRFSELATNGALFLGAGTGTSKILRTIGVSTPRAAQFGRLMSLSMIASAETGGTYDDLLNQLLANDVPLTDARDIASRGAIAVGVASTLLEMRLIDFNIRGANTSRFMKIVRGIAAETATEEAQLFANAGVIFLIEEQAKLDLENGLSIMAAFEAAAGATTGALTGPAVGTLFNTATTEDLDLTDPRVVEALAQASKLTIAEVQQKIGEVLDESESSPTPKEAAPAAEASAAQEQPPTPPAPTGEAQPARVDRPGVVSPEAVVEPPTPPEAEGSILPQAAQAGERARIQPVTSEQRLGVIQNVDTEALRRQQANESRVDDLNQTIAANLPEGLTKSQIISFTKKINNITSPKRLRVVLRQLRTQVQKIKTKQAQDRLKKVIKDLDVNTLAPEPRAAIEELLRVIDPEALSPDKRTALESLERFVEREGEVVPPKISKQLQRLTKKAISDFSESEAALVADEISRVITQAKTVREIRQRRKKRKIKEFIDVAVRELRRPRGIVGRVIEGRAKILAEKGGVINFVLSKSIGRDASTLESLIELLSGSQFSQTMDVLFTQVAASKSNMLARKSRILDQQEDMIVSLGLKDEISTWLRPEDTKERKLLEALGLIKPADLQTIELPSGRTVEIYKAERADFIHQLMDMDTKGLIIFDGVPLKLPGMAEGESIALSNEDVLAIVDSATADEIAFATQYFEIANGQEADDLAESTRKNTGVSLVRSDGHAMRERAGIEEPATFNAELFRQRALKNADITKDRNPQDKTKPIIITDIFSRMNNWATQHSAVIEMSDTMEQAMAVITNKEFKAEIINRHGKPVFDRLRSYYDSIAAEAIGGGPRNSITDRELRPVFGRITRGALGLRPHVAAYQAASIATMMTELNEVDVLASLGAAIDTSVTDEANANSSIIRERDEGGGSRVAETSTAADKRTLKKFRSDDIGETLTMGMIREVDRGVIRIIWSASKRQATREGRTGKDLLRRTAQIAERVVRRTQPTFDVMSLTGLALDARTQTFSRYLNFFRAQRSKNVDMTKMTIVRWWRNQISTPEMMKKLALVNVAQPLYIAGVGWIAGKVGTAAVGGVGLLVTGQIPQNDETDEEFKEFLLRFSDASLGNPIFGQTLSSMIRAMSGERAFDIQLSPVESIIEDIGRGLFGIARAAGSDDPTSKRVADAIESSIRFTETALTTRGIPIKPLSKLIRKQFDDSRKTRRPTEQPRR